MSGCWVRKQARKAQYHGVVELNLVGLQPLPCCSFAPQKKYIGETGNGPLLLIRCSSHALYKHSPEIHNPLIEARPASFPKTSGRMR